MTAIPSFSIEQTDGALGTLPDEAVHAKIGVCSAGTTTPTLVGSRAALSEFGTGPLIDAVAYQLEVTGKPVLVCRAAASVAGIIGSLTRDGTGSGATALTLQSGGTSTAVLALTATGLTRAYAVKVRVHTAGANLADIPAPRLEYSLDGGLTWSDDFVAAGTPLGSSGITLGITDGSFVGSEVWTGYATPSDVTGTALPVISGAPLDAYQVVLVVVRGAASLAANAATVKVSLDNGETFGPELAVPISGALALTGTGLTATFSNGTFVAGERYEFRTAAPAPNLSDISAAFERMLASTTDVELVHVVGPADSVAATAIDVLADGAIAAHKPRVVLLEARAPRADEAASAWRADLKDDFEDFVSDRVAVCAGEADYYAVLGRRYVRRSIGTLVAARAALVPISEDLAFVARGALPGVLAITHDEDSTPDLNEARFITTRQHQGLPGYYITNPLMMAAPGSDYALLQRRRVWDRAYRVLRRTVLPFLSTDLLVNPASVSSPLVPGAIDEVDAATIEDRATDALTDALLRSTPRHVTEVSVLVDRSNNLLTTEELIVTFDITPKAYAKTIRGRLGFRNPGRV